MKAINRLIKYIDYKGINKSNFEQANALSNGYVATQLKRNADLGEGVLNKILDNCLDLSPEWLLTGKGQMLRDTEDSKSVNVIHTPKIPEKKIEDQAIPLYDIEATAGLKELFHNKSQHIIDAISIPNLPKCDGAIYTTGDSMYPILKSGDIILYKEVGVDLRNILFGEMYLLSLLIENEEYITVKYVQRSNLPDHVRLASHNPHHDPKDVPITSIAALAIVKASIRMHTIL